MTATRFQSMLLVLPLILSIQASTLTPLIAGRILEACSCIVPCPCNFGRLPHPHHFCEYLAFFEFTQGKFQGVSLKGRRFAIASGRDHLVTLHLDSNLSTVEQDRLTKIASWVLTFEGKKVTSVSAAPIEVSFAGPHLSGSAGEGKAFLIATPLIGNDGKSEITVSRPLLFGSFPVVHSRKLIADKIHVASTDFSFDYSETNGNDAVFEFQPSQIK